ncbi:Bromodomain-containing protein 8 [Schistosoma japonicum]|nr:Bromodomain-containing protein 8 [Schistosoma japonicum]KAH8853447.1 Bromodomain-containing protein 8 [Schistosoma japonicum]
MNWAVGANCYLLRAVHTHGKNWDLVRESLKTSFKTFLKNENVEDLSNQSCSLQYKYIIACARQRNPGDLTESQLLNISLDHYTTLRREELHAARLEILRAIKIEEEDAEKLREARYSEIPADRILMYRTRCRSLGIPDRIGRCLNLEPLPPVSEENDRTVKNSLISPERQNIKTEKESVDENGGVWIPVKTSYIYELFKERPDDLQQSSLANFIRAQAVISQRLGFEGQDDEMSSLDTTSSVQTHSEITGTHNQEAKTELPESSEQLNNLHSPSNKTKVRTSPSKCLEILDEPNTPNSSALVSDSETLASPHFTQSLNSSPALSLVETQSPSLKAINCNRKRHTKKKISTAPVYQNHEAEFTSAFSPSLSTNLNNDELTDGSQSSTNVARRWRRSLLSALSTVYSHRHAYVFMHPVTEDIAPGYSTVVYEPVDLTSLRRRMESSLSYLISSQQPSALNPSISSYQVIVEVAARFIRDLLLMFMNARMYNSQNHEVHRMAGEMYHDVISELQPLWSIMAEDIPGFPTLPVYSLAPTQITHSLQQLTGVSAALPISPTNPSSCVPKDEESCATRQPCGFIVKQNKRPAPEGTSPSSPLPRKHRHSSGNDSVVGSVMTRSK